MESSVTGARRCRFCAAALDHVFVDLGMSPLCESYLGAENLSRMEPFYPLVVYVCDECFLVQLEEFVPPEEIFTEYAYFSSYADSWVEHARRYTETISGRLGLGRESFVVEVASNDGYLLQHFVARGVPCLGIEPARNVARAAEQRGVPTLVEFFGRTTAARLARERRRADLLLGNNVLAQVPDLNDFVAGLKILLAPGGAVTMEFPHLLRLMQEHQFDTIYHGHSSYFSLTTTSRIFEAHGLRLFDVEEISTHGGSLRIYACHSDDPRPEVERVRDLLAREQGFGLHDPRCYDDFGEQVRETKRKLLEFLIEAKRKGAQIVGYGAPGKGNTLLNYCGVRSDFLDYTVDRNPYKQGRFLPGTHIPIYAPERIFETRPDYVLILPWNFKDEILSQMAGIRAWGGKFVVPITEAAVIP